MPFDFTRSAFPPPLLPEHPAVPRGRRWPSSQLALVINAGTLQKQRSRQEAGEPCQSAKAATGVPWSSPAGGNQNK